MRTTKRKLLLVLLVLALPLLLFIVPRLLQRPPLGDRITPEAYERLRVGMTREEVQAAIGLPPGDYRRNRGAAKVYTALDGNIPQDIGKSSGLAFVDWWGDENMIGVWVDAQGKVAGTAISKPIPQREAGIWESFRRWIGL